MKTVVFAYHTIGCVGIRALHAAGMTIQAVFTHVDDPGENRFFDSVAELCATLDIPVYTPEDVNHPLWIKRISALQPDVIFSFYYRHLLGQSLLDLPSQGAFNLHGSLLPRYRGRAPVNWVLVNGETETGVTLHHMTQKADAGAIIAQETVAIDDSDTALTLHRKIALAARALLDRTLPMILSDTVLMTPQDESQASTYSRRTPADGLIDWYCPAREVFNLVRAVTMPYPGAFSFAANRKLTIWKARIVDVTRQETAGTVLSVNPFQVACGRGILEIEAGQADSGPYMRGFQLAQEMGVVKSVVLGYQATAPSACARRQRVLILGVNGFIGNHLSERLLADGGYEIFGMDISSNAVERLKAHPDFHFVEGDISIHTEWIEYHIKKCDIVIPLVAIATPIEYTRNPLRVFELDFEENLKIIRHCVRYRKRVIFPSTSEVYGMCGDERFDEDQSNLILGPINKQRWIYSASKQLLDRVIWAYGQNAGLEFTLFRPFNWMGPRLDSLDSARLGSSRAITQLILNLVEGTPIKLIDGGEQKRCFTDINDGIEALFRIVDDKSGRCNRQIINIGNPDNEASIRQLAETLLRTFNIHPLRNRFPPFAGFREVESSTYYGAGYQDVAHRRPSIRNARRLLKWEPVVHMDDTIANTLDFFLRSCVEDV